MLRVGHATALIKIRDRFVLTDPVFTETVGGLSRRMVAVGLDPRRWPPKLAVLVSHRHFDHLSTGTFSLLGDRVDAVLTPEGAAADIPRGHHRTRALEWWRSWERDGLVVTAVPAAHDGGRYLHDAAAHPRAFGGYVIEYRGIAVYFAGDTAYQPELFAQIAARFPALDLALLPIGPISPERMMCRHHLDPERALDAFAALGATQMVPIHFGTFLHSYDRPGDCESRLDDALSRRSWLYSRVPRLAIGERRVLIPLDGTSGGSTSLSRR